MQYLHEHLLGEFLEEDDPSIERTLNLWLDVFEEGQRGLTDEEYGTGLARDVSGHGGRERGPARFPP